VDNHQDLEQPDASLDASKLSNPRYVASFVDSIRVNEFIRPALNIDLFEGFDIFGTNSPHMSDFSELVRIAESGHSRPVVFDLDLDVFHSPLIRDNRTSHPRVISYQQSYELFAQLAADAYLTTIAFSPDYQRGESRQTIETHFTELVNKYRRLENRGGLLSRLTDLF
jgi:hypothetical protein